MLLNFQHSFIDPEINREMAIMLVPGIDKDLLYSPPEVISGNIFPYFVPRKVDIYCLALTAVVLLSRVYSINDLLSKFYLNSTGETSLLFEASNAISKGLPSFNQYMLHDHAAFIQKVFNIKHPYPIKDVLRNFTSLLAEMLSSNPMKRPSTANIEERLCYLISQIEGNKQEAPQSVEANSIKLANPKVFEKIEEQVNPICQPRYLLKLTILEANQKVSQANITEYDQEMHKPLTKLEFQLLLMQFVVMIVNSMSLFYILLKTSMRESLQIWLLGLIKQNAI